MKNRTACFTKQKTINALILLEETVTLDTFSIRREQPVKIKAYKIKFKTSELYLSKTSNNNPLTVSFSPFIPHFIIISLDDGVMYPSKF